MFLLGSEEKDQVQRHPRSHVELAPLSWEPEDLFFQKIGESEKLCSLPGYYKGGCLAGNLTPREIKNKFPEFVTHKLAFM